MNYPYDEVMDAFLDKHSLPRLELTEDQWDEFEKLIEDCMSEIAEQRSYTQPSSRDIFEMNLREKIEPIERNAAFEQKWRDEQIEDLKRIAADRARRIRELIEERDAR